MKGGANCAKCCRKLRQGCRSGNRRRFRRQAWNWRALALDHAVAHRPAGNRIAGRLPLSRRTRGELARDAPVAGARLAELRCAVPLPRHVELVSIDASDLQVDTAHSNLMLLTATLKNRAPLRRVSRAALTLTDTQDQPLARRVLNPPDYLDRKTDSKAGITVNGELAVKVYIDSRKSSHRLPAVPVLSLNSSLSASLRPCEKILQH